MADSAFCLAGPTTATQATARPSSTAATHRVEVAIVGAGLGGLCMAIRLLKSGCEDFLIFEKESEVGGAWRDNTYPGAACDVQSHLYSFSFAPKHDWSRRYAGWREIRDYIDGVVERFGLRRFIRTGSEIVSARFDEDRARWTLGLRGGATIEAQHWVLASGPLHFPAMPDIPGLASFAGEVFHSARWNHRYDLRDKTVASIGTGGSAIQYVPEIARQARRLYVFQRSAAWMIRRDERAYSALHKALFRWVPGLRWLHRARLYWWNEARAWPLFFPPLARLFQRRVLAHLRREVPDRRPRERLTPNYTFGCKRILISNNFYPTFSRPNVELVTDAIREIRPQGVVTADGVERRVDCIVLGTGFVVDPRIYMRDFPVVGRRGRILADDWRQAPQAYLGTIVAGYPNMYQLVGPGSGLGHNSIVFMIEAQVRYILSCMRLLRRRQADFLDLNPAVQVRYNARVQRAIAASVWSTGCRSWYQTSEGVNFALWPWSTWKFWLRTRRASPDDFTFHRRAAASDDASR